MSSGLIRKQAPDGCGMVGRMVEIERRLPTHAIETPLGMPTEMGPIPKKFGGVLRFLNLCGSESPPLARSAKIHTVFRLRISPLNFSAETLAGLAKIGSNRHNMT